MGGSYPARVADIEIRPIRFGAPIAQALAGAMVAEMEERYGGTDENPVEANQFDPPEGAFLIAWQAGEPIGCGGWRIMAHFTDDGVVAAEIPENVAEVKRMYTTPAARGRGVARALLRALEDSAREAGMRRLVLETGYKQPEAIALYESSGYVMIKNYGFYRDHEGTVSYGRDL